MLRILMLSLAILTVGACGREDEGSGTPEQAGPPTKESVVALLRTLEGAMASGDLDKAMGCWVQFGGIKSSELKPFLDREGLTKAAIDIVAANGKFGPFKEVFPTRADALAKKAGVDPAECFAISAGGAEVAVHWDGTSTRFIRLDDLNDAR